MKLLILFDIPLLVKTISLEETDVKISLMVTFVIGVFKTMRARFSLLSLKFWWIHFEICFAAPSKMLMMFNFMKTIVFDIL